MMASLGRRRSWRRTSRRHPSGGQTRAPDVLREENPGELDPRLRFKANAFSPPDERCDAKEECRAVATDDAQTRWMKKGHCVSPCFRQYGNWYMAFNERSPSPFNPDRE